MLGHIVACKHVSEGGSTKQQAAAAMQASAEAHEQAAAAHEQAVAAHKQGANEQAASEQVAK